MSEETQLERDQALKIHDLMMKLDEAEETLSAIRGGEVDALVIRSGNRQHVYTLKGADQAYRVLFETLNEGAMTVNAEGVVLFANGQLAHLLAVSTAHLLGAPFERFVFPADAGKFSGAMREAMAGGYKGEIRLKRSDGAPVPVKISMSAVRIEGADDVCTAVVTDLTELKRTQEALIRAHNELEGRVEARTAELQAEVAERQRLEQELRQRAGELADADRRKDEFLSTLAHELRNPLAPILNSVKAIEAEATRDEALQRHREVIERQTRNLARLVDDLLDLSRITHGVIVLRKEIVDLHALIARAVDSVRPLIDSMNHDLTVDLLDEPILMEADATRLEQVIVNLLTNSAKYTEPNGRILLSARWRDDEVILSVQDTGVGISPELIDHVFDLFVQADRSLDRAQGGLGIGLTLVQRLVELHGGTIAVSSDGPGKGSEFVVRLPAPPIATPSLASSAPDSNSSPASPNGKRTPGSKSLRVLVIDDNRDGAESLAEVLKLLGHEVRIALDGPSALEIAAAYSPEVTLLDIGLPGMDGYEVARRLRERADLRDTLLAALTGYGQEEDHRRTKEAGFDFHFVKPVDWDDLGLLFQRADTVSLGTR